MLVFLFYKINLLVRIIIMLAYNNWFLLWITIELITALLVVIISRKITPRTVERLAKYFLAQAIARILLLTGIIVRYYHIGEIKVTSHYKLPSYVLILMALFLKIALVPNPYWFVDAVRGLKFLERIYIVITSKIVPIYLYITISKDYFIGLLFIVGVASVGFGRLLALKQTSIRKIIALSSIAHLGWFLVRFPLLDFQKCLFIFFSYIIMVTPIIFICHIFQINDLKKIKRCYSSPFSVFIIFLSLLSLGGFPPLLGFFYKFVIFLALINKKRYILCGYLILMRLVSLFIYLRICYELYRLYNEEVKFISLSKNLIDFGGSKMFIYLILNFSLIIISFRGLCLGFLLR